MLSYVKNSSEINLSSRMDVIFWSPRNSIGDEFETKSVAELVGRDNLMASAFYPSIVPFYVPFEDHRDEDDEPFIRVADARNGLLDYNKTVFLPNEVLEENKSSIKRVVPGDIVITKGGEYIGEATLVPSYYDEYGTCRDILSIKMEGASVSGEYLTSYFMSSHGKNELIRTKSVQGQPHLTVEKVADIKVPVFDQGFQDEIASLWESFYEMIDDAEAHLDQAKYVFYEALGMTGYKSNQKDFFSQDVSTALFVQRFDVEYYEKKWSKLVEKLKNDGIAFEKVKFIKETYAFDDPKEKFNYITLSDIDDRSGIIKNLKSMEAHKLPDRAKRKVKKGDVLVSSLKGSKEKISIVDVELENMVASTGFYVVRDSKFLPEVLYLIFRSDFYDLFIEQMSSGSIMSSLTDKYFKQFELPVLSDDIQNEISEEVSLYFQARHMAFERLDDAIKKFDDAIN